MVERAFRQRQLGKDDVDEAGGQLLEQADVGRLFDQPDLDVGFHVLQRLRDDARGDRLERADDQRPRVVGAGEVGFRGADAGENGGGVSVEQSSLAGQRDRLRSAGALEQAVADDRFECCDLVTHRRLHVAEAHSGGAERSLLCDGFEGEEMPKLNTQPALECHVHRNGDPSRSIPAPSR